MSRNDKARLRRRTIGYVFQDFNLLAGLTAAENVALPTRAGRAVGEEGQRTAWPRSRSWASRIEPTHYPDELSGGERQRVAIARAVVGERHLLLADEPSGALDSTNGEAVMRMILGACKRGVAAVVVTHDAQLASWADRVVFLRDGRVVDQTMPPPSPEALLEEQPGPCASPVVVARKRQSLHRFGVDIRSQRNRILQYVLRCATHPEPDGRQRMVGAMSLLELHDISKSYGEGATVVHALDEIDLSVDEGHLVAVMGPSGSGKSTLLTIAGSLEEPTSGEVRIGGAALSNHVPQRQGAPSPADHRLRLPGLQSPPGTHRRGERRAATRTRRHLGAQGPPAPASPPSSSSGSRIEPSTTPTSSPAASASGSPSPGPSSASASSSSPTNPRARSTRRTARR